MTLRQVPWDETPLDLRIMAAFSDVRQPMTRSELKRYLWPEQGVIAWLRHTVELAMALHRLVGSEQLGVRDYPPTPHSADLATYYYPMGELEDAVDWQEES